MDDYAQLVKARITYLENKRNQEFDELKNQTDVFLDGLQPLSLVKYWIKKLLGATSKRSFVVEKNQSELKKDMPRPLFAQLWEIAAFALVERYEEKVGSLVEILIKRLLSGSKEER